jgi:phage gpG-like protein
MSLTTKPPFKEILRRYTEFKRRIWRIIGQQAVNFFKDNFTRQGFLDGGHVNAWRKRDKRSEFMSRKTRKTAKRGLLISTGRLRKSIRIVNWGQNFATVGTDIKYARIHNEGGIITQKVTAKQRAFFWRMFYITKDEIWQSMALSETIRIRIPKRKFMGSSTDLAKEISRTIRLGIIKIFKK